MGWASSWPRSWSAWLHSVPETPACACWFPRRDSTTSRRSGTALVACGRCEVAAVRGLDARGDAGLALGDFAALARAPEVGLAFDHVVLVDPPPFAHLAALAARGPDGRASFLHAAWGEQERAFA